MTDAVHDLHDWSTVEADDLVVIVGDWSGRHVMVWFDEIRKGWDCYACGQHPSDRTSPTCAHVQAACRELTFSTVLRIAALVHKPTKPSPSGGSAKTRQELAVDRVRADALARGAEKRALRNQAHDELHRRVSPAVTVRPVTDADRRRVAEARRRRACIAAPRRNPNPSSTS